MSTATESRIEVLAYRDYLDRQLDQARRRIKILDVMAGAAVIGIGLIAYVLTMVIFDQIVVLSSWIRLALLAGFVLASAAYAAYAIILPGMLRVNRLYAARAIESAQPTTKNSVSNWVELERLEGEIPPYLMKAIETRAAEDVAAIDLGSAIDSKFLTRSLYVLATVVVVFCFYSFLTYKRLGPSIQRVLFPLRSVDAPTSTRLVIEPGDVELAAGETMNVRATVDPSGKAPDAVTLYVSSNNGDYWEPYPLEAPPEPRDPWQIALHDLQRSFDYYVAGGDYVSKTHRATVTPSPLVTGWRVKYEYPAYTKKPTETVEGGDIDALVGTKATIFATTNFPPSTGNIEISIAGEKSASSRPMLVGKDSTLETSFVLEKDGAYRVRFTDLHNRSPLVMPVKQIKVRPDLPPGLEFVEPEKPEITAPANGQVRFRLQVNDDFGLERVRIVAARASDRKVVLEHEVTKDLGDSRLIVVPVDLAPHDLEDGDVVEYYAEAWDGKRPTPNHALTLSVGKRTITITKPLSEEEKKAEQQKQAQQEEQERNQDQQNQPGEKQEQTGDQNQDAQSKPDGQQGEQKQGSEGGSNQETTGGEGQKGEGGKQGKARSNEGGGQDENSSPAEEKQLSDKDKEALKRLQDYFNEKDTPDRDKQPQEKQKQEPKQQEGDQGEDPNRDQQKQDANKDEQNQEGQQKSAEKQAGQKQSGQPKQGTEKQAPSQKQDQSQTGDQSKDQNRSSPMNDAQKQDGQQSQPGDAQKQSGEKNASEKQGAQKQDGQSSDAQKQDGQQPGDQKDQTSSNDAASKDAQKQAGQPKDAQKQDAKQKAADQSNGQSKDQQAKDDQSKDGASEKQAAESKDAQQKEAAKPEQGAQKQPAQEKNGDKPAGKQDAAQMKEGAKDQAAPKQDGQPQDAQSKEGAQKQAARKQAGNDAEKQKQEEAKPGDQKQTAEKKDGHSEEEKHDHADGHKCEKCGDKLNADGVCEKCQGKDGQGNSPAGKSSSDQSKSGSGEGKQQDGQKQGEASKDAQKQPGDKPGDQKPGDEKQPGDPEQQGKPEQKPTQGASKDEAGKPKPESDDSQPGEAAKKDNGQQQGDAAKDQPRPEGKGEEQEKQLPKGMSKQGKDDASAAEKGNKPGESNQGDSPKAGESSTGSPSKDEGDNKNSGGEKKGEGASSKPGDSQKSESGQPSNESAKGGESKQESGEKKDGEGKSTQAGKSEGKSDSKSNSDSKSDKSGGESGDSESKSEGSGKDSSSDKAGKPGESPRSDIGPGAPKGDRPPPDLNKKSDTDVADSAAGDEENLKKASNLVLKKIDEALKDKKVDPEMLKKFGMTEDELRNLHKRLRDFSENEQPKEKVDDPLKAKDRADFGKGTELRTSSARKSGQTIEDDLQQLHEGRRVAPPEEIRARFEAYTRSLSRIQGAKPKAAAEMKPAPKETSATPK